MADWTNDSLDKFTANGPGKSKPTFGLSAAENSVNIKKTDAYGSCPRTRAPLEMAPDTHRRAPVPLDALQGQGQQGQGQGQQGQGQQGQGQQGQEKPPSLPYSRIVPGSSLTTQSPSFAKQYNRTTASTSTRHAPAVVAPVERYNQKTPPDTKKAPGGNQGGNKNKRGRSSNAYTSLPMSTTIPTGHKPLDSAGKRQQAAAAAAKRAAPVPVPATYANDDYKPLSDGGRKPKKAKPYVEPRHVPPRPAAHNTRASKSKSSTPKIGERDAPICIADDSASEPESEEEGVAECAAASPPAPAPASMSMPMSMSMSAGEGDGGDYASMMRTWAQAEGAVAGTAAAFGSAGARTPFWEMYECTSGRGKAPAVHSYFTHFHAAAPPGSGSVSASRLALLAPAGRIAIEAYDMPLDAGPADAPASASDAFKHFLAPYECSFPFSDVGRIS
jgi:hypothetical protein